ncbi:MAG: hypothetical protein ACJAUW_002019, partial [Yoonia sp.]
MARALTNINFGTAHWLSQNPTYNITNEAHHEISPPGCPFARR